MESPKEIEFLEFLEPKDGIIRGDKKIAPFMIANFPKPDPLSETSSPDTDEGVIFLQDLSDRKLIRVHMDTIRQVNNWKNPIGNLEYKYWFDTQEHTAHITKEGIGYLSLYRSNKILLETSVSTQKANESSIRTNKSVTANNRNTIRILIVATIISLANLGIAFATFSNENDKEQLRTLLQAQSKQLSEQQSIINQQQLLLSHLIEISKTSPKKN